MMLEPRYEARIRFSPEGGTTPQSAGPVASDDHNTSRDLLACRWRRSAERIATAALLAISGFGKFIRFDVIFAHGS
jgi:hypothetical protein